MNKYIFILFYILFYIYKYIKLFGGKKMLITICGPSGAGKSRIAKELSQVEFLK